MCRTWFLTGLLASCVVACGGKVDGETASTTGSTTNDTADTDEATIEAVYPTAAMDRVLLYYGHGGFEPASTKGRFEAFDDYVKTTFGWNTDHRSEWTDDMSAYRMVGLVALGHDGGSPLDDAQLEGLQTAMSRGTRVVFFADRESCGSTVMADTLGRLGSTMGYTGDSADANMRVDATDLSNHQLTDGQSTIIFKEPCWVNSTGGSQVVNHSGHVVVSAQRPATGGDIVVIGDFQVIDDSGYLVDTSVNNLQFAENLVKVDPAL